MSGGLIVRSPTAVGKALLLLGSFSLRRSAMTLSELSRSSGLTLSTTHRIVGELLAWGALERSDDGLYSVGLRIWELGALAPRGSQLREAALPFMEDLYEVTHENVQLGVREGLEVVFVERFAGRSSVRVLTEVGGRFPLQATGVGLVLLAHSPLAVQDAVLSSPLQRFTEKTIVDPTALRRELSEIRRTGLAISDRQVTMDAVSVAAPIMDADGTVIASLSIVIHGSGPDDARRFSLPVQTAARGVSRDLGIRSRAHGLGTTRADHPARIGASTSPRPQH